MALKYIANNGYAKTVVVILGSTPQGTVTEVGTPSSKVKLSSGGVLKSGYQISVANVVDPGAGATIADPGPFSASFTAQAVKTKADGVLVLRLDDETSVINATPRIPGSPPTDYPVSFKYKISNAGQTKGKAE